MAFPRCVTNQIRPYSNILNKQNSLLSSAVRNYNKIPHSFPIMPPHQPYKIATDGYSMSSFRLFSSSSFEAPPPPTSKGEPVYEDIDLEQTPETLESIKRNKDPNAVFVVTGASRGIGLQYVKSLLERTKGRIVACCRNPTSATKLQDYLSALPFSETSRIEILELDVQDSNTITELASHLKEEYDDRVDLLFNVAGVLGDGGITTPGPERSLSKVDQKWLESTLQINLIGPMLLCQALTPMMITNSRRNINKNEDNTTNPAIPRSKSVIVNLSARVGSISDNELGGWYSYRVSKAALNQATRTMAHELKRQGIWSISLHPGTTDTDLSRPFQRNVKEGRLFPVEFTVSQLLDVMEHMEESHSGGFYDWAGKALPF